MSISYAEFEAFPELIVDYNLMSDTTEKSEKTPLGFRGNLFLGHFGFSTGRFRLVS